MVIEHQAVAQKNQPLIQHAPAQPAVFAWAMSVLGACHQQRLNFTHTLSCRNPIGDVIVLEQMKLVPWEAFCRLCVVVPLRMTCIQIELVREKNPYFPQANEYNKV